MSAGTISNRPSSGSLGMLLIPVLALILGSSIVYGGVFALAGLVGLIVFGVFVRHPVLGMYATVAMLILQGSTGIVGVAGEGAFALTLAQLAGFAAITAWGVNVILTRTPVHFNAPVLFIGGFMVWALFSVILSPETNTEFPHWVRLFTRFLLFFLAVNTLTTEKKLHWFLVIILLCALIMAVSAIVQYVMPSMHIASTSAWGGVGGSNGAYVDQESLSGEAAVRVSGRSGHSNWLALFVLLVLPLNTYWFTVSKHKLVKIIVGLTVAAQVLALILTFTRTGLVIGVMLAALLVLRRAVSISPLRIISGLLLLVIGFGLLPAAYKERVLNPRQYTQSKSVLSRIDLQEAALRYAKENPVFGLGTGGFGEKYINERSETAATMRFMVEEQGWQAIFIGTHNMYLQLAADTGVVGFVLFIIFYAIMLRELVRKQRRFRQEHNRDGDAVTTALFVSLVGFMLCAVFLHALHQEIWWMIAAAAVAVCIHDLKYERPVTEAQRTRLS